jgi:hypothetical protein
MAMGCRVSHCAPQAPNLLQGVMSLDCTEDGSEGLCRTSVKEERKCTRISSL